MASRPLPLVSAGLQGRSRETNYGNNKSHKKKQKNNSNGGGYSNGKTRIGNYGKRGGGGGGSILCPIPSAGRSLIQTDEFEEDYNLGGKSFRKKGGSGNHLLNWQSYEPQRKSPEYSRRNGRYPSSRRKDADEYVQATAQFIMRDDIDLDLVPFDCDPDIPVPWKFIEAIRFFSQEETECPVCLHPPIAAKVGRCGHAHCYSCVLHLIDISELTPQCPICHADIIKNDLRSATFSIERRPKLNASNKVEFVKVKRKKTSIVGEAFGNIGDQNQKWLNRFGRVLTISPETIKSEILTREEVELAVQRSDCEESEVPFIEQAQDLVQGRIATYEKFQNRGSEIRSEDEDGTSPSNDVLISPSDDVIISLSDNVIISPSDDVIIEPSDDVIISPSDVKISCQSGTTKETIIGDDNEDSKYYYYYQIGDGGNIFLSSLNARCLATQYSTLKNAPNVISAKLIELEDFCMDEEARRRFRYLSSLSLGEPFSLAFVDNADLGLDAETLNFHKNQIENKNRRRNLKQKEEKKATKQAEEYYNREVLGKYTPADISLSSHEMFPNFDEVDPLHAIAQGGIQVGLQGQTSSTPEEEEHQLLEEIERINRNCDERDAEQGIGIKIPGTSGGTQEKTIWPKSPPSSLNSWGAPGCSPQSPSGPIWPNLSSSSPLGNGSGIEAGRGQSAGPIGGNTDNNNFWKMTSLGNAKSPNQSNFSKNENRTLGVSRDGEENDMELRAPNYRDEFASDLFIALEEATKKDGENGGGVGGGKIADTGNGGGKRGKKGGKRKKGRVIFST